MQTKEFNNLMNLDDTKWTESLNIENIDMKSKTNINTQIKNIVKDNETHIPEEIQT